MSVGLIPIAELQQQLQTAPRSQRARLLKALAAHYFSSKNFAVFFEIDLWHRGTFIKEAKHCRADVLAINSKGHIVICEVKSSRADYKADTKWDRYRVYSNQLYFLFPPDMEIPEEIAATPDVGVLYPGTAFHPLVSKKPARKRKVAGKLRKATILSLLFRAADATRYKRKAWKNL